MKIKTISLSLLITILLFSVACGNPEAEQTVITQQKRITELENQINELTKQMSSLEEEMDNLKIQNEQLMQSPKEEQKPQLSYSMMSLHADLRQLLTNIKNLLLAEDGAHYKLDEKNQGILHNAIINAHYNTQELLLLVPVDGDVLQLDIATVQRDVLALQDVFNVLSQLVNECEKLCQLPEVTQRIYQISRPKNYLPYIDKVSGQIDIILKYLPHLPIQGKPQSG